MAQRSQLGDLLVKHGVIDSLQLRSAQAHVERWGGRLTRAISELGLADEDTLVAALAEALRVSRVSLGALTRDAAVLSRVSVTFAESKGVFPVALRDQNRTLQLAMVDPTDLSVLDQAAALARARIVPAIAGELEIAHAISRYYRGVELPMRNNRARAAVQASQRHTTATDSPSPSAGSGSGSASASEVEFDAEAMGTGSTGVSSAGEMLDQMMASGTDGWSEADRAQLQAVHRNQEKSSQVLRAMLELLVDKGLLRPSALEAWRRGEPLPPLPQLRLPAA